MRLATRLRALFILASYATAVHAELVSAPIASVSSSTILKTDTGKLLVLYGVEAPRAGTTASQSGKEFTTDQVVEKNVAIELYAEKYGITYVRVILPDKRDLSKVLLEQGLATWDRAVWPDLKDFAELEAKGRAAVAETRANAQMQRDAERAAAIKKNQEEEAARQLERWKKDWEKQVKDWNTMSAEERKAMRDSLEASRKALEPKFQRARNLYNAIARADDTIFDNDQSKGRVEEVYAQYRQYYGPDFELEFRLREAEDIQADNRVILNDLIAAFDQVNAEINAEYPAYAQESQRIAALDATLPPDKKKADNIPDRTAIAKAAENSADSTGTGFLIANNYLMTCDHVVRGGKKITVRTRQDKVLPATIVVQDADSDWCVLKVSGVVAKPIPVATAVPEVGSTVFTLGYPFGSLMENKDAVAGSGNVAALQGIKGDTRHLQVTVPLNEGASGSPIMNTNGEWIGLASHKVNDRVALEVIGSVPQGLNFAVKANFIETNAQRKGKITFDRGGAKKQLALQDVVKQYSDAVVLVLVDR